MSFTFYCTYCTSTFTETASNCTKKKQHKPENIWAHSKIS